VTLGLPANAIMYASLGATYKLNPPIMDAWVSILAAVPDAVLWLLDGEEGVADRLRGEVQRRGIAAERLIFAPFAAREVYLARRAQADLFLDTHPVGAHTTGSDALFMGVPLLTSPGRAFASRVGESLVAAVELPEPIAESGADYVSCAIDYGRNPVKLGELRRRLEMTRTSVALWDGDRVQHDLEAAYEVMWARHQAGLAPSTLRVSAPAES
jgi:protein O-GlcNAc transferase